MCVGCKRMCALSSCMTYTVGSCSDGFCCHVAGAATV